MTSAYFFLSRGHSFPVGALDVSESGILLSTGSIDTTARIWVPERTNFVRLLAGHYASVSVSCLPLSFVLMQCSTGLKNLLFFFVGS